MTTWPLWPQDGDLDSPEVSEGSPRRTERRFPVVALYIVAVAPVVWLCADLAAAMAGRIGIGGPNLGPIVWLAVAVVLGLVAGLYADAVVGQARRDVGLLLRRLGR